MSVALAVAGVGAINTVVDFANKNQHHIQSAVGVAKDLKNLTTTNSLVEYTHGARVEPLTIIGADCINVDFIADVMQSLQTLFSGYYLQAVAMSTQINGVSVTKHLDRLNPNRNSLLSETVLNSAINAGMGYAHNVGFNSLEETHTDWRSCTPSYRFRLPTTKNSRAIAFEKESIALEARSNNNQYDYYYNKDIREEAKDARDAEKAQRDKIRDAEKAEREKAKESRDAEKSERDKQDQRKKEELADAKFEDDIVEKLRKHEEEEAEKNRDKRSPVTTTVNDKMVSAVRELADLSVGKMINVIFGGGKDSAGNDIRPTTIPISIRLMVNTMSDSSLVGLLCSGSMDNSITERYHAWRSGRIGFVRDLILCQDLIDEHKKAMIKDHSGVHNEILRRVNNSKIAGLITKDPSLNVASNLFVISEVTATTIERKLGGKLSNINVRNKIFESGYAMIIAVVDRRYEVVTFYHRGISTSTTVTARDLKISNKSNGPDVSDILKAYVAGNSPSL